MTSHLSSDNASQPKSAGAIAQAARLKIDHKTKPLGSLGVLENVAVRLASLQQTLEPQLTRKRICVFAGTHGVTAEGVSAYPSEVTGQMVLNFLNGGAAINVLARHAGIDLHIIDTGVDTDWPEEIVTRPNFFLRPVRRGTRNFLNEPAMSPQECEQAIGIGREEVRKAREDGVDVLGIGEMGIGNTTSASCLLTAFCGLKPAEAVGRGTGITDAVLDRKVDVVARAIERYTPSAPGPGDSAETGLYWLRTTGGFEIAAMTGAILGAAEISLPLVVDGFIATAAAAAAFRIDPKSRDVCFFSHRSNEQAHGKALLALGAEPLLDLQMRLGEGTGAALAMPILEAAAKLLCEMATFDSRQCLPGNIGPGTIKMNEVGLAAAARRQKDIFLAAVMFLTRLPVGKLHRFRTEHLASSAVYFPVVGALVGLTGGLALLTSWVLPSFAAALACMLVTICLTGGLHEDGLADAADGLIGGQTEQRRLEIMKDSRLGAFGALALWFSLTAKLILIQSLTAIDVLTAVAAVAVANSLGRTATVALLAGLPYVRSGDSKSGRFGNNVTPAQFAAGAVFPVVLSLLLLRLPGLVCLATAAAVTLVCCAYFKRKISGITGDCLGAANQLVELGVYVALLVLQPLKP